MIPHRHGSGDRTPGFWFAVAVAVAAATLIVVVVWTVDDTWRITPDSAGYVGLARSLAEGDGYSLQGVAHTKYPPLFPLVLAAVAVVFGADAYRVMQLVQVVLWLVVAMLVVIHVTTDRGMVGERVGGERRPSLSIAAVFGLLTLASVAMLEQATLLLQSELLYMVFSLAAVVVGHRVLDSGRPALRGVAACAVLAQLAFLTRVAGITVLAAMVLALVDRRRRWVDSPGAATSTLLPALVVLLAVGGIGPVGWAVRNTVAADATSSGYHAELLQEVGLDLTKNRDLDMRRVDVSGLVGRVVGNAGEVAKASASLLLNSDHVTGKRVIWIPAAALVLAGFGLCLVRRRTVADFYCLLYLGLHLVWPFHQQERFYLPLLPFLLGYAAVAVSEILHRVPLWITAPGGRLALVSSQAAVLVVLLAARSRQPDILGRYSVTYAVGLAAVVMAMAAFDLVVLPARVRGRVDLPRIIAGVRPVAAAVFVVGYLGLGMAWIRTASDPATTRGAGQVVHRSERYGSIEIHRHFLEIGLWLRQHTPPETVVMTDIPKILHLVSGRRTVPFTFASRQGALAREVAGLEVEYVHYTGEIPWIYEIFESQVADLEAVHPVRIPRGRRVYSVGLYRAH